MSNIQDILDELRESIIDEKINRRHYMIREKYVSKRSKAKNYEDVCNSITHYFQCHYSQWTGSSTLMPKDLAFSQAKEILDKGQGGFVARVKDAIWGRGTGLIGLLDDIANTLREDAVAKYIEYILTARVNPMNYDLKVKFMRSTLSNMRCLYCQGNSLCHHTNSLLTLMR